MILDDSESVKKKFEERLEELIKLDEKEYSIKLTLIYSMFALTFLFICISAFIIYKNYKLYNSKNINQTEIIKVKVIESENING